LEVKIESILRQNITMVFDSLDLQTIDINKLKSLFDDQSSIMNTPEIIVAISPEESKIIQIGERRVRVNIQKGMKTIGEIPIWETSSKALDLVPKKFSLIAYGFNYDVICDLSLNANDSLKEIFLRNEEKLDSAIDGQILSFSPRLIYTRQNKRYELLLEAVEEVKLKGHLNAHFQREDINLPTSEELKDSYLTEFDYFQDILTRLFQGA